MCTTCGSELSKLGDGVQCSICSKSFCRECEKSTSSGLDGEVPVWYCRYCSQKHGQESSTRDDLGPYSTPSISPAISLTSYESCVSSCGEVFADSNLQRRKERDEGALDTGQEHHNPGFIGLLEGDVNGNLLKNIEIRSEEISNNMDSMSTGLPMEEVDKSNLITVENLEDYNSEKLSHCDNTSKDVQIIKVEGDSEVIKSDVGKSTQSFASSMEGSEPFLIQIDPRIWIPPEPENKEDDMDPSVADNDDDDEYSDGTKWGQPSSLNSFSEEHGSNFRFKEERQKAMVEVMNGRFRTIVRQLLMSKDIAFSKEAVEDWLDIVASLSWEAATLIKPEANEGIAMDPGCYLKVKCIASGSRIQSQVIRGLVFKKSIAHKHMPTKYKNPRLLLLQGILGQRSRGLSSFDSMEQERDYVKSINDMIEMCQPNVVLVEKTVSRDFQESLLAKGITLVFDMKLQRLERIACCTGSQIVSSSDSLTNPKLKQCDSFHVEKFVEELISFGEGGKRPSKTLMFFEGCPRPMGCTEASDAHISYRKHAHGLGKKNFQFPSPTGENEKYHQAYEILLKGAHSDELKKVKSVVQYAVFVAYHLILETSFLVDQRAIFPSPHTVGVRNGFSIDGHFSFGCANELNSIISSLGGSSARTASTHTLDVPIYEGMPRNANLDSEGNSAISGFSHHSDVNSYENDPKEKMLINSILNQSEKSHEQVAPPILPGQLFSSLSSSLKRFLGDSLPYVPASSYESISTFFGFKDMELDSQSTEGLPVSPTLKTLDYEAEAKCRTNQEKNEFVCDGEKVESMPALSEIPPEHHDTHVREIQIPQRADIKTVLGPQGILVLLSSRCVSRGNVCKQSFLSRIKYYGNSDISLGRFLRNELLNQHRCLECEEPPENHVYCYVHENGKLTILVKRLPLELILPGEAEEKLWMWSRCLKCEWENKILKPTRRVVMSTDARALSFGKFLELTFSNDSASSRISSCGHSLHRECLHFYGLGSMVVIFGYSSVEIYTACMPPPVLEFNNPNGQEWLSREAKEVLEKGILFFTEVTESLQKIGSRFNSSLLEELMNLTGYIKEFSEIEEMLKQEKSDFEKAISKIGELGRIAHQILGLNRLNHELLLESYVWDRRLHSLVSTTRVDNASHNGMHEEKLQLQKDEIFVRRTEEINALENGDHTFKGSADNGSFKNEGSYAFDDHHHTRNFVNEEASLENKLTETSISDENLDMQVKVSKPLSKDILQSGCTSGENCNSIDAERLVVRDLIGDFGSASDEQTTTSAGRGLYDSALGQSPSTRLFDVSATLPLNGKDYQEDILPVSSHLQVDHSLPNTAELLGYTESILNFDMKTEETGSRLIENHEMSARRVSREQQSGITVSHNSLSSNLEDSERWVWSPFSEICKAYKGDLQRGYSQKFEFINSYTPTHLSSVNPLITQERSRLHFPVGTNDDVVSVYEDEFTSIIACALASLWDHYNLMENGLEKETRRNKEGEADKQIENPYILASDISMPSPYWSSSSSSDLEGISSGQSVSFGDLPSSGSEVPLPVDPLHPEISLGVGKLPGKSKYSVVCVHAKQFYGLRRRCCPNELDYISSLSRCKNWDAQGGKSKAFFAKTLDDRFIVKQVKKTELDSFMKFSTEYFKHISHSLSSGSQTCLAKILGIYQVIIQQTKSSKELKIDLVVMENLFFGRNVSRMYDLKGALHSRYISNSSGPGKVLLDQNFVDDMHISPYYVGGKTKHLLQRAIWNDTSFLTAINVMDYSLLVGVDKQRHELVFGIIDYLRQYTWDKQLETWVKASLVVPKNALPTVISPKEYKKRFRKFMSTYFLTVPDSWCSEQFSGPPKFFGDGSDEFSPLNNAELTEIK
ncbi:FORMS APLOID AND BINUCLEATE CELLS 1A isoform X2 [Tasmannia lanceolata]|uniref:FORMS APLOID AND BINUCLEATE CELLS 1A isoform X2 n=1 Tax=Tasmannia lanceolata TaxID=3420 RepID=UPI004063A16D